MDLITLALAKKYVNKKFAEAVSFGGFQIIDTLPVENISDTTVYLLKSKSETEGNVYEEYIYTNGKWESLGTTVDLAGYITEENLQAALQKLENKISTLNTIIGADGKLYTYSFAITEGKPTIVYEEVEE